MHMEHAGDDQQMLVISGDEGTEQQIEATIEGFGSGKHNGNHQIIGESIGACFGIRSSKQPAREVF